MSERARNLRALGALATLLLASALPFAVGEAEEREPRRRPEIRYEARVVPSEGAIHVTIDLAGAAGLFEWFRLSIDPDRHTAFAGDGVVTESDGVVEWRPPRNGGRLSYTFRIDHLRNARSYDARGARTWAIFRGDDMVPTARSEFVDGTRTRARLQFVMPEGWSVASPHPRIRGTEFRVANRGRAFTRPTGWFALGELGVVREDVAGTHVAIAAPVRHGFRRLDLLALLRLTLPELNRIRGEPMERLLVVGAGDPMWRGGLSGPASIYLHAERPLITDDATSPLLHELVHTSMSARADDDADWIVEGLAEYYSTDLLRRIGALSQARIDRAIEQLREGGGRKGARGHQRRSSTQQGVLFMLALDAAIRDRTAGQKSLDDVYRVLASSRQSIDLELLQNAIAVGSGLDPALVMPEVPEIVKKNGEEP